MLKVLALQTGTGLTMAAAIWAGFGNTLGFSALLGAIIAAVPNAFLALRLAAPRRDPGARSLVRAAYIGELGKLALTVLLFSIVFVTVRPLAAAPLFATYVVTALVPIAGLALIDTNEETVNDHGE